MPHDLLERQQFVQFSLLLLRAGSVERILGLFHAGREVKNTLAKCFGLLEISDVFYSID